MAVLNPEVILPRWSNDPPMTKGKGEKKSGKSERKEMERKDMKMMEKKMDHKAGKKK